MTWEPGRYLAFGSHRLRPAADLLSRIPVEGATTLVDIGCGPGNSTRLLCERWPRARVLGVDNSAEMIGAARAEDLAVDWFEADIANWSPTEPVDVLFSNAALHWVGDHDTLFPRLIGFLRPGGVLAVQMPHNFDSPSHRLIDETIESGPWRARLEPLRWRRPVLSADRYYDLLSDAASSIDIWETEYLHVLDGSDPVLAWTRGTALLPYAEALPHEEFDEFTAAYAARLRAAYPQGKDGKTLFPFRRLFIVATREE